MAGLYAASEFAEHVWISDISERAGCFATFNMRLNGLDNLTVLTGDLYAPLEGHRFDYIACHPPYMPALGNPAIYRAGGEIGDELILRIVGALPTYLVVDGLFYAHAIVTDRRSKSFEDRVREALADSEHDFDILTVVLREMTPLEFCNSMRWIKRYSSAQALDQMSIFSANGVDCMIDALFLMCRRSRRQRVFTARHNLVDSQRIKQLFHYELNFLRTSSRLLKNSGIL